MDNTAKKPQVRRIFELDFIRGILIFLMCLQHLCWFFYRYLYCGIWNPEKISDSFQSFGKLTNDILYGYPYNPAIMVNCRVFIFFDGRYGAIYRKKASAKVCGGQFRSQPHRRALACVFLISRYACGYYRNSG
jgi:hypothetical protein